MRVSLLLRLFKPRRISSTSPINSKNLRTWSGGNINLLFLPNFGFTKFNQKNNFSSKQESYFSAIGGESDEPPPELTPEQVTAILSMNEVKFLSTGRIKKIECNQLAANDPTEDRLRVSKLNLAEFEVCNGSSSKEATLFAVFDGHGGRLCADVITKRLFSYIALSLCSDPVTVSSNQDNLDKIIQDLQIIPNVSQSLNISYGPAACERIKVATAEKTKYYLERYAQKLKETSFGTIEEKLSDAFLQCDQDLSDEIEHGLKNPISNVLTHYYLSMAVSGCCVTLIMVHGDDCYIASTGDCKAVLGFREAETSKHQVTKSIDLTNEHNSDNAAETKRLLSAHPSKEKKTIIKNDRLLSHLMPFRAFGDFCYKWEIEKIKQVGLTKAFGPHIIPPNYFTPPYLTAQPEVSKISLSHKTGSTIGNRYIVIATDGLWEQYDSSRCLIKQLFRHQFILDSRLSSSDENISVPKDVDSNQSNQPKEVTDEQICYDEKSMQNDDFIDTNSSTHLIRVALGTPPLSNMVQFDELVQYKLQHKRISTFLTLPSHLVRNFRDDITVIVLKLD